MWNAFWSRLFSTLSYRFFRPVKRVWFHPVLLAVVGVCLTVGLLAFHIMPGFQRNDAWMGFAGLLFFPFLFWLLSLLAVTALLIIPRLVFGAILVVLFLKVPFLLGSFFGWVRQYLPPELLPPGDSSEESESPSPAQV
ncbi:MAG: hypothetical protein ACK5TO_03350 [Planctomycetaceae bacterium]